jgi:SpoVK/Ycf46/Vps4 family AAA+-type ATPase
MARADALKKLILSYQRGDDIAFRETVAQIIEDERKKHHVLFANELEKLLKSGLTVQKQNSFTRLSPPPADADKGIPLLEIHYPDRYLDELVLEPNIRQAIERVMNEFRSWEVLEANGLKPVRRLLFCGPSGCGKTAAAEVIASELGLPLLYIRFDAVVSSLLGETASNLRKVFEFAQQEQWVMFFDEFDAIGRSRDDPTEHGEIKRVVNSFLQILDNFKGRSLVVAATNFEQAIDPAVWRRFDDIVRFEKPDVAQLKLLIKKRLQPLQFQADLVNEIANQLDNATYADAERVCVDIRKSCAMQGHNKVQKQDIAESLDRYAYRRTILDRSTAKTIPVIDIG